LTITNSHYLVTNAVTVLCHDKSAWWHHRYHALLIICWSSVDHEKNHAMSSVVTDPDR